MACYGEVEKRTLNIFNINGKIHRNIGKKKPKLKITCLFGKRYLVSGHCSPRSLTKLMGESVKLKWFNMNMLVYFHTDIYPGEQFDI